MVEPKRKENQPAIRRYAHIVGWGMAVPEQVLTNDDLSAFVETNDQWIRERTGIRERRIASDRESTATLSYRAAQSALEVADILPIDLDLIIVATSTPEHVFPSTASLIQDWLGASRAGAFDLSAACSGFVYAVKMAADAIRAGGTTTCLVVGAETMSRVLDWQDRGTCILFGDGAGAVVLQASEQEGGVMASVLRSDGAGGDLLAIPTTNHSNLNGHKVNKMYMAGSEVFKFATRVIDESVRQVADHAGIALNEVDLIIPHQANQRILASAARKLEIDPEKFISNVERYGNTSAASIPIALCEALEQGRIREENNIIIVGFGGGLTWAAMLIRWVVPEHTPGVSRIKQQRRRIFYTVARWRARWRRWRRHIDSMVRRTMPRGGRASRLRHKLDKSSIQ